MHSTTLLLGRVFSLLYNVPMKKKIIFIAIFVLSVLVISIFFGNDLKNTFHLVFSPVERSFYMAGENASSLFRYLLNSKQIERENEEIKAENFKLTFEVHALKEMAKENENLRQALSLSSEQGFQMEMAQIISSEPGSFLINKGQENNVLNGMPVITKEGVLVGKIKESLDNFAYVDIISNLSFDVKINDTLGAVVGKDQNLKFQWVPNEAEIKIKDKVITVAVGGNFPAGLLVGEIESVKKNDAEAFQEGTVLPYFQDLSLDVVFIITNFK